MCYSTCGRDKGICDSDFLGEVYGETCTGMLCICVDSPCAPACSEAAYMYYGAVDIVGDDRYHNAQLDACACCNCD